MPNTDNQRVLKDADLWEYNVKVMKWSGKVAHPNIKRMRNPIPLTVSDIQTDSNGNITDMPLLVGRPCFAIPTAYLRQRMASPKYVPNMQRMMPASKCERCKVRQACKAVTVERLRVAATQVPQLTPALRDWTSVGGFDLEGFEKALNILGEAGWRNVYFALQKVDFSSSNDLAVSAYWKDITEKAYAKATRDRLANGWKNGDETSKLISGLNQGRQERIASLAASISSASPPKYLRRYSPADVNRITAAWWGREYAKLTGKKVNSSSIARIIIETNLNYGIAHSSLRSSVKSDLEKIRKLEACTQYNGGQPIWPRFTHPSLKK